MSDAIPNDGLLKTAKILITLFQVLLGIGFVALLIASPVVLFSQEHIADELLPSATASTGTIAAGIAAVLIMGAGAVGAAFYFLKLLKAMINSVGEGDPFILENSERLSRMGWIAVIVEVVKIPASAVAIFVASQLKEDTFTIDHDFSLTGFLVALVLFILARVFRHGAAMREDLEGTV